MKVVFSSRIFLKPLKWRTCCRFNGGEQYEMPPSWRMALNDASGLGQAQRPSKACTSYGSFLSVSLFRNWARMVFHNLNYGPNPSPIANKKVPHVLFSFVTSSSQPNQNTRGTHENTFAINSRGSTGAATRFFISLGPSVQFSKAWPRPWLRPWPRPSPGALAKTLESLPLSFKI